MTVDLDRTGLWQNAADSDSCPFVFTDATHDRDADPLAGLREAVLAVNSRAETELVDGDGFAPAADQPQSRPRGPMASVFYDGDPDVTIGWFQLLADHLTAAGWSGHLAPVPWAGLLNPATVLGQTMTAVLATSGWWRRRPNGAAYPIWRSGPEPAPDLTDLACDWVTGVPGRHLFSVVGPDVDATPGELRELIHSTLADQEANRFLRARTVEGSLGERAVRFGSKGHVFLSSRDSPSSPAARLEQLAAALIPWATRCDHAYVAGFESDPEQGRTERGRDPLTKNYQGGRWLDQEKLPDAFAWQLVTGRHLSAAHDLSGWRVDEIADDRFTVAHPEPEAWFLPHPEHGDWTTVDPDVLARARADFGDLILRDPIPPRPE